MKTAEKTDILLPRLCDLVQASVNARGGFLPVISQLTKTYVENN